MAIGGADAETAETAEAAEPVKTVELCVADLEEAWRKLDGGGGEGEVGLVALGNPHLSPQARRRCHGMGGGMACGRVACCWGSIQLLSPWATWPRLPLPCN